jgi:hypothetical protein
MADNQMENPSSFQHQTIIFDHPTTIQVRNPGNKYQALTKAFIHLFKQDKHIIKAYLVECRNPEKNEPPHPLVGIESDLIVQETINKAGLLADKISRHSYYIDFITGDTAKRTFSDTKPFYTKAKRKGLFW